jgi:hypothetical protein
MIKRYPGGQLHKKGTSSGARHPSWTDGETNQTIMHWKIWARKEGLEVEPVDGDKDTKVIIHPITLKRIKLLKRSN